MGETKNPSWTLSQIRWRGAAAGTVQGAGLLNPEVLMATATSEAEAKRKEGKEMQDNIADPLAGLLFGQGRKLVNLKMLRGDDPNVTEADLRNEAHAALLQVMLGTCESHSDFPEDRGAKRVDIGILANI